MRLPAAALLVLLPLLALARGAAQPSTVAAGTVQRLEIEELLERSDQVLEGRVRALHVVEAAPRRIETEITLAVSKRYWGEGGREFVLRVPGGVLPDGRGLVLPGLPRFSVGEELLLFLSEEGPRGTRMPIGLAQGRFRIERTPAGGKRLVREQAELEFVDAQGRSSPAEPRALFDYAALVARVEAAAQQRRQREGRKGGR